jgi:hypothetical protein
MAAGLRRFGEGPGETCLTFEDERVQRPADLLGQRVFALSFAGPIRRSRRCKSGRVAWRTRVFSLSSKMQPAALG